MSGAFRTARETHADRQDAGIEAGKVNVVAFSAPPFTRHLTSTMRLELPELREMETIISRTRRPETEGS